MSVKQNGGNMVTSIARQSIIIKCKMQKSGILGNYEFYYAAGLSAKLFGFEIPEDIKPGALAALLADCLKDTAPKDEKEEYLLRIVKVHSPEDEYDTQMKELLLWGMRESNFWQA